MTLILVSRESNDLCNVLRESGVAFHRAGSPEAALAQAAPGSSILILADGYPERPTTVDPAIYAAARERGVRLYVEFPDHAPPFPKGEAAAPAIHTPGWERVVVASGAFAPALERLRILMAHDCRFVEIDAAPAQHTLHLVLARVAGYDTAVYGLPEDVYPLLWETPDGALMVAATKLSHVVTGRYAPPEAWRAIWRRILAWAMPDQTIPDLAPAATVRPTYTAAAPLPDDAELRAFERGATWYRRARLLIHPSWQDEAHHRLHTYDDGTGPGPAADWPVGDGRHGMIEGASSRIHPDGSQDWRYFVRNDCVGEASMAHAFARTLTGDEEAGQIAANLNDFIYTHSVIAQGPRGDPASPSFGLLSWDTKPPGDGIYYGDDNARSMLGTLTAAALLATDRWDRSLMRCLLANLRTTGPSGFRQSRISEAELQEHGWHHFWEKDYVLYAPHYESWLWAALLWAYRHTGYEPFLTRTLPAIRRTVDAYPDDWHWTNGIQQERARMLLPLAWLVRLRDTGEHRAWLRTIAGDLLAHQDGCGAIREEIGSAVSAVRLSPHAPRRSPSRDRRRRKRRAPPRLRRRAMAARRARAGAPGIAAGRR